LQLLGMGLVVVASALVLGRAPARDRRAPAEIPSAG
jgi:hypothetical protein